MSNELGATLREIRKAHKLTLREEKLGVDKGTESRIQATSVSKWSYSRVNFKIVMTRVNHDRNWIEERPMTKWERLKWCVICLKRKLGIDKERE
jgi:hypothetical protein